MPPARPCPACLSQDPGRSFVVDENMYGTSETFRYDSCNNCGTLVLGEVPDDLSHYYPQDYYSISIDPEWALGRPGVRHVASTTFRSALQSRGIIASLVERYVPKRQLRNLISIMTSISQAGIKLGPHARVLDVGCGSGLLVFALGLAGVKCVQGVDPFMPGDKTLSTGGNLLRCEVGSVDGPFDLIMFNHSFEHVPDPEDTLRDALARLSPAGRILIRMPTPSSDTYEEYGPNWAQLDPPRHLVLFSRAGVELLCRRVGLIVEHVIDDSTGFQFWASEQSRIRLPLLDARSAMVDRKASPFTSKQLRAWDRRARSVNERGRGDQAAWILSPGRQSRPHDRQVSGPN